MGIFGFLGELIASNAEIILLIFGIVLLISSLWFIIAPLLWLSLIGLLIYGICLWLANSPIALLAIMLTISPWVFVQILNLGYHLVGYVPPYKPFTITPTPEKERGKYSEIAKREEEKRLLKKKLRALKRQQRKVATP